MILFTLLTALPQREFVQRCPKSPNVKHEVEQARKTLLTYFVVPEVVRDPIWRDVQYWQRWAPQSLTSWPCYLLRAVDDRTDLTLSTCP
jgi:hypothetical protein